MPTPSSFTNFGELLKHLRLRAQLTQRELALDVGYHYAHLSRLENNQRIPDAATLKALFIPALGLDEEPEWATRLLELAAEGRSHAGPPPPPSLSQIPVALTPLLGREASSLKSQEILMRADVRLLTLVGPPGIGKTRLALQIAGELASRFADGVVFVDLTPVRDPEGVASEVAGALGVKESAGHLLPAGIVATVRNKTMLLVLDNFEQVMDASPQVAEWLRAAGHLKVLATSREPLHLSGEYEFPVPPLDEETQVELFVQRAQAVSPAFAATPGNKLVIAEICRRLDGLALAIELAAARARMFSVQSMLERLDRRLEWLTLGAREGPAWRQTLRGAIDWSYDLLEPAEQTTFARMAVFSGGCTPELAALVTGAAMETLLSLADKNLVTLAARGPDDEPRFTLLETLREYAGEHLAEIPEVLAVATRAHAVHYLEIAEALGQDLAGPEAGNWLRQLELEHENFRAALSWTMAQEPELGLRLVLSLDKFWKYRGHFSESRRWQEAALPYAGEPQRIALTRELGETCWNLGAFAEARDYLEESVSLARLAQDKSGLAEGLNLLGRVVKDMGSYDGALTYLEEGLALARANNDPAALIPLLRNLGNISLDLGRMEDALSYFEESLGLARRAKDSFGAAAALNNLGIVHIALKNYPQAKACFLECLPIFQEEGFQFGTALAVVNIGRVAHAQGELEEARRNFETSLRLAREIGKKWSVAYALSNFGLVACDLESWDEAEAYFREALQTAQESEALPRTLDTLGGWAILLARTGKTERAAELLGLVRGHPSTEHEAIDRSEPLLAELRVALPAETLESALRRGSAAKVEEVARLMLHGDY